MTLEETDKFITVLEEVADSYGVPPDKILSDERYMQIVEARQMICFLLLPEINEKKLGKMLKRDRRTVLRSGEKIKDRIMIYADTRKMYKQLIDKLGYDDQTE